MLKTGGINGIFRATSVHSPFRFSIYPRIASALSNSFSPANGRYAWHSSICLSTSAKHLPGRCSSLLLQCSKIAEYSFPSLQNNAILLEKDDKYLYPIPAVCAFAITIEIPTVIPSRHRFSSSSSSWKYNSFSAVRLSIIRTICFISVRPASLYATNELTPTDNSFSFRVSISSQSILNRFFSFSSSEELTTPPTWLSVSKFFNTIDAKSIM